MCPPETCCVDVRLSASDFAAVGTPHVPPVSVTVIVPPAGIAAVDRVSRARQGVIVKKEAGVGRAITSVKPFGVLGHPARPVCVGVPERVLPENVRPVGSVPLSENE